MVIQILLYTVSNFLVDGVFDKKKLLLVIILFDVNKQGGCAYFTTQLVSICGQDLSPFAAKLIRVFVSGNFIKSILYIKQL